MIVIIAIIILVINHPSLYSMIDCNDDDVYNEDDCHHRHHHHHEHCITYERTFWDLDQIILTR